MRRHPPPEVDPERVRTLLASARTRPDPPPRHGWIPEEEPPTADLSWLDESSVWDVGPSDVEEEGHRITRATTAGRRVRSPRRRRPHRERQGGATGAPDDVEPWPDLEPSAGVARSDASEPSGGGRHRPHPRILTVPVAFRGARVTVSVRAVVAFLVVLVVAVVFFAVRVARAQQAAAPQPVPAGEGVVGRASVPSAFTSSSTESSGGTASPAGAAGNASSTGGGTARGSPGRLLVVDVVGHVARPGVVTVPDGSRVVDVLAAAGGALAGADMQRLNLARLVVDGEQVFVPNPGETAPILIGGLGGSGAGSGPSPPGAGAGSGSGTASVPLVDLNTATLAALDTLPGVGPVLAQRILDWRAQHGRFTSVDELGEVSGIGDKLLEQIRPKVTV